MPINDRQVMTHGAAPDRLRPSPHPGFERNKEYLLDEAGDIAHAVSRAGRAYIHNTPPSRMAADALNLGRMFIDNDFRGMFESPAGVALGSTADVLSLIPVVAPVSKGLAPLARMAVDEAISLGRKVAPAAAAGAMLAPSDAEAGLRVPITRLEPNTNLLDRFLEQFHDYIGTREQLTSGEQLARGAMEEMRDLPGLMAHEKFMPLGALSYVPPASPRSSVEVSKLGVLEPRRGIGSELMNYLRGEYPDRTMSLSSLRSSMPFYRGLGYRPEHYDATDETIRMSLPPSRRP